MRYWKLLVQLPKRFHSLVNCDWEYSIERILHNFALRLVVPEKYYKQVNEYVNGHNLRGRIVYQRYQGAETIREFG